MTDLELALVLAVVWCTGLWLGYAIAVIARR